MRNRRGTSDACAICRDFGALTFRVVRVTEGPDRGGARGKVTKACRSMVAALERSAPCPRHTKSLRLARDIVEDLTQLAAKWKPRR